MAHKPLKLPNEVTLETGRRLRSFRGDRSQADFAKEIGMSPTALSGYELGTRRLGDDAAKELQRLSGRPVAYWKGYITEEEAELLRVSRAYSVNEVIDLVLDRLKQRRKSR